MAKKHKISSTSPVETSTSDTRSCLPNEQSSRMTKDARAEKSALRTRILKSDPKRRCSVCGDAAPYRNYGARVCSSCKIFFKRAVLHNRDYQCNSSGNCTIDMRSRKGCRYCRHKRCINAGMRADRVKAAYIRRCLGRQASVVNQLHPNSRSLNTDTTDDAEPSKDYHNSGSLAEHSEHREEEHTYQLATSIIIITLLWKVINDLSPETTMFDVYQGHSRRHHNGELTN